jgi:hypothetical protein
VASEENEVQRAGGSVALLCDDQFGFRPIFFRKIGLVEIGAIDEHHHVGVLLDGARFAEVGKLRLTLFAFGSARELAENDDRQL